ncbi:MAG: hypothetical protein HKN45_03525 [Flavobacteriales bacterium]|nr:hypothetical protein [Flavobacteriales bacterium]
MFYNVTTSYTGADATIEILVMLSVAFLLGMLFRFILARKKFLSLMARNHSLEGDLRLLEQQNELARSRLLEMEAEKCRIEEILEKERSQESEELIIELLRKSV